jgi:hypothetical protein
MAYAAVALVIIGSGVGVAFRLKVLLPILALLLILSIVFAVVQGFDFLHTAFMVIETQTSVQTGYFLGVVVRSIVDGKRRMLPTL